MYLGGRVSLRCSQPLVYTCAHSPTIVRLWHICGFKYSTLQFRSVKYKRYLASSGRRETRLCNWCLTKSVWKQHNGGDCWPHYEYVLSPSTWENHVEAISSSKPPKCIVSLRGDRAYKKPVIPERLPYNKMLPKEDHFSTHTQPKWFFLGGTMTTATRIATAKRAPMKSKTPQCDMAPIWK